MPLAVREPLVVHHSLMPLRGRLTLHIYKVKKKIKNAKRRTPNAPHPAVYQPGEKEKKKNAREPDGVPPLPLMGQQSRLSS